MGRSSVAAVVALLIVVSLGIPAAAASCPRGHVALTFDDGPGPYTPAVLDVLAARQVPATFFVVGSRVPSGAATLRRAAAEGHVIGNHTYNHENLTRLTDAGIRSTVARAHAVITSVGVQPAPIVRPPFGATNSRVVSVLLSAGYAHVFWTIDPRDWAGTSPDGIARTVLTGLGPGANVVLHDGSSRTPNTIAALPTIIDGARSRGYCFGVIDDAGRVVAPTPPPPVAEQVAAPVPVDGLAGGNRYETAVTLSQAGWPQGADTAVLASGQRFPDALTASALAGVTGAPLLLSPEGHLDAGVQAELSRLGASRVYLLGPLSDDVEAAVVSLGAETVRIRGADRYETSELIAHEAAAFGAETSTVLVATGEGFADALAASVLAARLHHPILLTRPSGDRDRLAEAIATLGAQHTWVVGGPAVVPDDAVAGLPGLSRLAGGNRAATATVIADRAIAMGFVRAPLLASGQAFPDGLAGGVLAARLGRPLLVTSVNRLSPEVHVWNEAHGARAVTVLGGSAAVGAGPRCQLTTGLDRPEGCLP